MDTLDFIAKKFGFKNYMRTSKPVILENFGRNNLAVMFAELGFKTGVEIGVERGRYSKVLCEANPGLHLYAIDPWTVESYPFDERMNKIENIQSEFEQHYQETLINLALYNCTVIRDYSLSAAKTFDENSLDFVYIDGNHELINCLQDISEWSKKIRPGGIISGHDYARYKQSSYIHVKAAVEAYVYSWGISPWFIVGGEASHVPGIIRDIPRSWFWVKR